MIVLYVYKNRVSVIIPCYNEALRLDISLFENFSEFNILFVNDGSTDSTQDIIEKLTNRHKQISCLQLKTNVGKAEAIRQGVLSLNKQFDIISYLDADLSTNLEEMERLIKIYNNNSCKLIIGSRLKVAGSHIKRSWWRHFSGRIIATVIDSWFLKSGIYDTQCGAKVMDGEVTKWLK